MKAANWAIRSAMPLAPRSTIPDLIVACVVGDGEAETGPLATAWQSNKFLNAVTDGAVLPILHLNGYKISNPTVLSRIEHEELEQFFQGCGWTPYFVEGDEPETMHQLMAATMEKAIDDIQRIQTQRAGQQHDAARPRWPMIVLRSPKGWTGPKVVDGLQIEGTFRAHQVPMLVDAAHPDHVAQLESWMKSYKAEELFDDNGRLHRGTGRAGAEGRPADGRQSACQRRDSSARPADAGFSSARGNGAFAWCGQCPGYDGAGQVPARHGEAE